MKIYKTLPDGMQIVEYEDALAPAIADMWNRSGEGWGGSFGGGNWTAGRVVAEHSVGAFFNVYIAIKNGEALGYCSFDRYYKDEDTAYVHLLNVRPDHHGKKIGKELVLMCVNETIARGMPRLDIHTWPGNTKSVPLYKKCGFLLEDRADTTHLINFIPTVLSTELFSDFFKRADWYADSSRKIEIKPDGRKTDKFEFFEYEWEKGGETLRVGFEKSGRRIRLAETADYKIEMTAPSHELAFGFRYVCRFEIVNKTGRELDVEIAAKSDGAIAFDGAWAQSVAGTAVFEGEFSVGEIDGEQDPWRMHPCVLADVKVNGRHAEFGLGVEAKPPVTASLIEEWQIAKPGVGGDVYINIKNNLHRDATVRFTLPQNGLTRFGQAAAFGVGLEKGKDKTLTVQALVTGCGYECLPVTYEITLDNGETVSVARPLHLVNQGAEGCFAFETDSSHGAANGMWRLQIDKLSNIAKYDRLIPSGRGEFSVSRLGKPYNDEFNITAPADVRIAQNGGFMRLEADFESQRFSGAVLTEIFEIDAAGTLKRRHRLRNNGQSPLDLHIKTDFSTNIGTGAVFHYDGGFHGAQDEMIYGLECIDHEKIDENWTFSASGGDPSGVYWPPQYSPQFRWGDIFQFEYPAGELAPGQCFETEPVVFMCGVFKDFREFRNYVLGVHDEAMPFIRNHLEITANGGNPVLSSGLLPLSVRNNRMKTWEGPIGVSSPDGLFAEELRDTASGAESRETAFLVPVLQGKAGIRAADFALRFTGYEKDVRRTLLVTDDTRIESVERDGVLTVSNGDLRYSASPGFSDAVYSLSYRDNEWFYSRYPSLEPYSWWNDFTGGLKTFPERMSNNLVLREKIAASFASEADTLGNLWTGIRTDVTVESFDEYKGVRYSQYYLTLPGVPVLCHFTRLENGTGRYMDAEMYSMLFITGSEGRSDIRAAIATEDNGEHRLRLGGEGHEMCFDRLAAFSYEGDHPRAERLYVYKDSKRDRGKQTLCYDIASAFCEYDMKGRVPDGGHYTTKPLFCILTEKELTLESLTDLSRIRFS